MMLRWGRWMREDASDSERNCPASHLDIATITTRLSSGSRQYIPKTYTPVEGSGRGTVIKICLEHLPSTRRKLRYDGAPPDQSYEWNKSKSQLKILEQSVTKNNSQKLTYMIKMPRTINTYLVHAFKANSSLLNSNPREERKIQNIRIQKNGNNSKIEPRSISLRSIKQPV
jgi:hypothetical protein